MLNIINIENISKKKIEDNHNKYVERVNLYKSMGFDQEKARRNIIECIGDDNATILEVGTGKGYLTAVLAKKYASVFSVDISKEDQEIACLNAIYAKVIDKIHFEIIEENRLEFRDYNFDSVVSAFTFHHMKDPYPMIDEMIRLFRNILVISDFNKNGYQIINKAHQLEGRVHHKENNEFDDVKSYLEGKGLLVSEKEDECQKILIAKRR